MTTCLIKIWPAATLSILEQYQRRSESCPYRLIGAVMGHAVRNDDDQIVGYEIRHCFPVLHSEVGDQIAINADYFKTRVELHRQCYGKESTILGWYSAFRQEQVPLGAETEKNTLFINEFFAREVASLSSLGVHLCFEVLVGSNGICQSVFLWNEGALVALPMEYLFCTPDVFLLNIAADHLKAHLDAVDGRAVLLRLPKDHVKATLAKIKSNFDCLSQYLEDAESGKKPCDPEIIKTVSKLAASVLSLQESMQPDCARYMQDMQTLDTLAAQIKAQVQLLRQIINTSVVRSQ